ncbi:MAG: tetratricopeptide repeat protein [Pseudomonadota bacterium]
MAPLTLHLTGPLRILDAAGHDLVGAGQRGRALLAFLACQTGLRAERAALADLLWSDRPESQARASLRQELSALRRALPDGVLSADRFAVWLESGAVEISRAAGDSFLQGFDLPSEGFEQWLRLERRRTEPALPQTTGREQPSLAILPFAEMGASAEDMFADGIVEEVTGALSRVHDFHVIARQSTWALRDMALTPPDIASRLGADYLVEGSVRRAGDRVRISVHLIRGRDAHTIWSERFDDRLDDLFDLQDRIAARVAGHLSPNLRTAEILRAGRRPPDDRTAYERTLTGLPHFWVHDADANRLAIRHFDAALAIDPDYALARAMKAWGHAQECCYLWTLDVERARRDAGAAASAAFEGARDHPRALTALSAAAALARSDFAAAEDLARRALQIDPNNAWAWLRLGWTTTFLGRAPEALDHFDRAEALSPLDPFRFNMDFGRGCALRTMRRLDEAIASIERGLRAAPTARWANRMLFGTLWLAGRQEEAIAAGWRWLAAHPGLSRDVLMDGMVTWHHDPDYSDLLHRFDELIPSD